MKDSAVLKRSMFSEKLPKSVRNSGIMAGFEDDDMLEAPEESTMPQMARTPQNPEILMNTLRGDMRSVDARYQELAQMVGDEAAQETPPEVLAMLQMQFGQQQGGIGALPQGADMMPPPMEGGAPMGAPGGAPAMPSPQGMAPMQGAMPPGMESAGPLPQGGAEQAPPTPDGMPPMRAAAGAFANAGTRAAQFIADKAATYGPRVNQYLGNLLMSPQPTVQRLTGGQPAMNLTRQGAQSLVQNPVTGEIVQGAGTKLAPYTTLGGLQSPTLTQGISQGVERLAAEYPRAAALLAPTAAAMTAIAGPMLDNFSASTPMTPEQQAKYDATMAQIDAVNRPDRKQGMENVKRGEIGKNAPTVFAPDPRPAFIGGGPFDGVTSLPMPDTETVEEEKATTEDFINQNLAKPKELSRIDRIKAAQEEYTPLYKELIGDSAEDAKTNAMLLLADAGFKLASTYKPTLAMAVAESAKDLPRGFANILAQARDRDIKLKTAALTQAISDVQEQDKYAQALKLQILKGDYSLLEKQATAGQIIMEDAGLGGRVAKTKSGSFVGFHLDPKDPAVTSALRSRHTLRDTDNPFVMNRGEAPTTVETNKEERVKLGNALRIIDGNLATIDSMKSIVEGAYSPGTWFSDKINNIFVPISFGAIKPNFDTAGAVARLKDGFSKITKGAAAAADSGRVSNQQLDFERDNNSMLASPAGLFEDPELAAKNLTSLEATNRNMRQQILTQLGYETNDYVMTAPNTGTKNDPYVISSDPREQKIMFNFLGSTFGRVQDPKAVVYLKLPNGKVDAFNPSQLRAQTGR
jgi:hypothetical protein